jgi:predicted RNA binding protein YcfA (HicA-like mRNA interferase family)
MLPKLPKLTALEAEKLHLNAGFVLARSKGSHKIYIKENKRQVFPFYSGITLHPKIAKQVYKIIES